MKPMYIGGNFEIDLSLLSRPDCVPLETHFGLGSGYTWLNAGRHAFGCALDRLQLRGREILIPEFLCEAALIPQLTRRTIAFSTYALSDDLSPEPASFEQALGRRPGAVLFVNYFGLVETQAFANLARERVPDIHVVLDNVQAFFDLATNGRKGRWADWQIFGVRKFFPVPDGGVLKAPAEANAFDIAPSEWAQPSLHVLAGCLRNAFVSGAGAAKSEIESWYLDLFEQAERALDGGPRMMSPISRAIVERLPLDDIAARRRNNYQRLHSALASNASVRPVLGALPADAVPLVVPVRVRNGRRNALRRRLAERGMFCPVHWPLSDSWRAQISPATRDLADEILSLPVDQRYAGADIARLVAAIDGEIGRG